MPDTENEVQGNDIQSELMDMIIADESPATISDRIKDMLFAKSAEKVDAYRPEVASNAFGDDAIAAAAVQAAASEISGEAAAEREQSVNVEEPAEE
tara:strand:+ start:221 stop:508 length:288 start_codon:yes stop_codon:yes gene_type:complete